MISDRKISISNSGRSFSISMKDIIKSMSGVKPERMGKYGVKIDSQDYPVLQVMAKVTNTPKIEWNTGRAYQILKKLGFEINIHE
jgi:hypothetical protein